MAKPLEVKFTAQSVQWITPSTFVLTAALEPRPAFRAGQFISLGIPVSPEKTIRRAYSIASRPEREEIELCITKVENGPGSTFLSQMKNGDTLKALFPYGDFVLKTSPERGLCFIATGTGVSPYRSIVLSEEWKNRTPKKALLLFGARAQEDVLYRKELEHCEGIEWKTCLSREQNPHSEFKGRVTDYLRVLPESFQWKQTDFYLCGNGAMIKEVEAFLKENHGLTREAIHKEAYYQPKL